MKKRILMVLSLLMTVILLAACSVQQNSALPEKTEVPEESTQVPPTETTFAATEAEPDNSVPPDTIPTEAPVPFEIVIKPVISGEQEEIIVTTADEFLAALGSNRIITINTALLDLSKASDYGSGTGEYYYWAEAYDGPELYISGCSNLTIQGSGEDHSANVISALPRYANVLNFENCANVLVTNLTAGHAEEPGFCAGGVLNFQNCENILVLNCGLFGCGTLGVKGYSSMNMQIIQNDIYDCSVGGVEVYNCHNVNVDGNTFRDLGGPVFRIYESRNITCNGEDALFYRD